jgi:hypothetical protein
MNAFKDITQNHGGPKLSTKNLNKEELAILFFLHKRPTEP